ncbi:protease m1 zinc metalloprotease [Holotrichia oblita]|uniref:Protease m1 zinc metalloprotease n=1 Tax=Holotrichia oblita TaxID=644536 RepID=A0ACB9T013_HOLOL|nr:protease m1 zinc metalloprotease [Holotrichia oblita]
MGTYLRIYLIWCVIGAVFGYRLPDDVIPEHYTLQVITDLDNFDFNGKVWIDVTCKTPTNNITLHSKLLNIDKTNVTVEETDTKKYLNVTDVLLFKETDFLTINLPEPLKVNEKYKIYIPFDGKLANILAGYYRSSYQDVDGKQTWLATTQFQPSDARRAFPCFDEPAMKAKFSISIGRKEGYTAISKPGWEWDRFQTTVPISTYLIAYAVSDFVYETSPKDHSNVTFRIWCRKSAIDQIGFAKDVGPKILSFYEKYFEIDYPLPKQDMIAVPDFSAGAMENWGLITFREVFLLLDPQVSSTLNKLNVISVIAHELAHQWFGNLVTMKWWSDLWLNEGFATFMSAIAVDHIFPEWNSLEEDTSVNIMGMFNFDAMLNSHPVSVPIGDPKEIEEIFDPISYKKGSSVLHMMSKFLGSETLRKAVSNYLKIHKYSNADKDDLFESITEEAHRVGALPSNLTVKTIMDTWTLQTGYPVITVKRNYEDGTAVVTQKRYLKDRTYTGDTTKWWIPLTYTTSKEMNFNDTETRKWFASDDNQVMITDLPSKDDWVIFNIQTSGLYRVNYDEKNWNLLIDYLKGPDFEKIPILNRVFIIDNAANFARIKEISYELFFKLLEYLKQEEKFVPWKSAIRNLDLIYQVLRRTPIHEKFTRYMQKIVSPIYSKIGGFHKQDPKEKLLYDKVQHEALATAAACKYNASDCVEKAQFYFKNILESKNHDFQGLGNDFRGSVYCMGIKYSGRAEWETMWNAYLNSNVASLKNTILSSLGCSRDEELLKQLLESAISNDKGIRTQDVANVYQNVIASESGFDIAKNFINDNIKTLFERVKPTYNKVSTIINTLAQNILYEEEYKWVCRILCC